MSASKKPPLRLIYMGTADFAVPALQALAESRHEVVAVYTQPARPAGRGMKPRPSPVERAALALGLPISTPVTLKEEKTREQLASLEADLAVVAAYGLLLPQVVLDIPSMGCVNLHGSCLPRWRGAAPIQRAIIAGDQESGVTIIQMEAGLDTGPMLAMETMSIGERMTAQELHDGLAELAATMIVPMVDRIAEGGVKATAQPDDGAVYAHKIEKSEGHIDWQQPAVQIDRQVRALNPWPGCWTELDDQRLRILSGEAIENDACEQAAPGSVLDAALTIACGEGRFRIAKLQRAGGKPMIASDFLRGFPIPSGKRFSMSCLATS